MREALIPQSTIAHPVSDGGVEPFLLAGRWCDAPHTSAVVSPYGGAGVALVAQATAAEVAVALNEAQQALEHGLDTHVRAEILESAAQILADRREQLARTISAEAGKPIALARVEADRAAMTFRFAAVEARRLAGEVVPVDAAAPGAGKIAFTLREPIGVVAAITPFNFPLNLVAHKVAPAIAAGCPVVLKPARATPLSALRLGEILLEAGLPGGFLSVLPGPASEIGDVLVHDERVRLISFTGSAEVGWGLRARAPRKQVALELGNNAPTVVARDADLDRAARRLAFNAFAFAGQSCISVQRIYVEDCVAAEFIAALDRETSALGVGDPADDATVVGPMIALAECQRALSWIDETVDADGAELLRGGEVVDGVLQPTVLTRVPQGARVSAQEVFAPVVCVESCADVDEGLARANDSVYGLQAAIFTGSLATAYRAARSLRYGGVIVNDAPTFRTDQMPYGGIGESGNTREGPAYAVRQMTEDKLIVIDPA